MGLAITIGGVIALAVGLLLWCRGAMAAAERRHRDQLAANARRAALLEKTRKLRVQAEKNAADRTAYLDAERARQRSTIATAYARPSSTPSRATSASTRSEDYTPSYSPPAYSSYDYGSSSSDSYSGGGSCSSDGGGGGGGCD